MKEDFTENTRFDYLQEVRTSSFDFDNFRCPGDVQILDGVIDEDDKRYMHQYTFPPFSVGDVRPLRSPGRREIDMVH